MGQMTNAALAVLMSTVVDPAADQIWKYAGSVQDASGTHDLSPKTPAAWNTVIGGAEGLKKGAKALRGDPRFTKFAGDLDDLANQIMKAVNKRDSRPLLRLGGELDALCERCHQQYWYNPSGISKSPSQFSLPDPREKPHN